MKMDPSRDTGGDGEHREEDLKERGEEGAQGHWVSLAPEVKVRERHAEEACRVLRQQLPVAVEEYVSAQLEAMRRREGEDDWPAPRRGDVASSWSWKLEGGRRDYVRKPEAEDNARRAQASEQKPGRAERGQPSDVSVIKVQLTYLL